MASEAQLEMALRNAHAAGDIDAARRLAAVLKDFKADPVNRIMQMDNPDFEVPGTVAGPKPTTLGEDIVGTGEAGLTALTGATGGTLGMTGGFLKGIADEMLAGEFGTPEAANRIEQKAFEAMQSLTYAPRTPAGQKQTKALGEAAQGLAPIAGLPQEMAMLGQATTQAAKAIPAQVRSVASEAVAAKVTKAAKTGIEATSNAPQQPPTPGFGGAPSAGAAGVTPATIREAAAAELPVPVKLTKGQATREFGQQRFERETAKVPEAGAPLRERFAQQNEQLQQNFDAFIDSTGAEAPDLRSIGQSVDKALRRRIINDKAKIRKLYKDAEKAGEMEQPTTLGSLVQHLNESAPEAVVSNVLPAVRQKAIQVGAAIEGPDGQLIPQAVSLKDAELLRRSINNVTNAEPTNIRQASIMKGLIDDQTADLGGNLYKKARQARVQYRKDYEDVGLAKRLTNTKKGTEDRAIALEDVLRQTVITPSSSLDSLKHVRNLLTSAGPQGKQAWRELQGGTLQHIKDEALKNVATDQFGNRIISPSQLDRVINQLDRTGKLDFIFGKKQAEQLRLINDVAKDVLTSPPGAINTSNTAGVLAGMLDIAISGTSGVPAPVATSFRLITKSLKNSKLRKQVNEALGEK